MNKDYIDITTRDIGICYGKPLVDILGYLMRHDYDSSTYIVDSNNEMWDMTELRNQSDDEDNVLYALQPEGIYPITQYGYIGTQPAYTFTHVDGDEAA